MFFLDIMEPRLNIKLVQLPIPEVEDLYRGGNIPLAAGYLAAHALQQEVLGQEDIRIIPRDLANCGGDTAVLEWIVADRPSLVGFTCYQWNIERHLWLAQEIKAAHPEIKIVLGGPEIVPRQSLADAAAADVLVTGEGEQAFVDLLLDLRNRSPVQEVYSCREAVDLRRLPNPYLERIVVPEAGESIYLETMRGCPYQCKYCFYARSHRGLRFFPESHLRDVFALARSCGAAEIYLMDPSFNVAPGLEERLRLLGEVNTTAVSLHTEMRLESVTPRIARWMKAAGFGSVEVGLQSVNLRSLEAVGRVWDQARFIRGARLLQDQGIDIKTGVILGLPHDDLGGFARTLDFVAELNLAESMEIYPLSLLPGTRLREEASELGITFMSRPPYWVQATPTMSAEDFKIAVTLAEEKLDIDFFPPVVPRFANSHPRFIRFLDLRSHAEARLNRLFRHPERTANSLTLLISSRLDHRLLRRLGKWLKQASPFTLVQLVLEDDSLPPPEMIHRLAGLFYATPRYFDLIHYYKADRQPAYSFRFFLLTRRRDTAERVLNSPQYGDLVLKFTPAVLAEGRHILEEHPLLLVDSPAGEEDKKELRRIYAGFENFLIFSDESNRRTGELNEA